MTQVRILVSSVRHTGAVGWRLLTRNNRPLASGVELFPDPRDCVDAVHVLQQQQDSLSGYQSLDLGSGRWVWRVELAGRTVAVTAREYQGRRECEASLSLFLGLLGTACVETTPTTIDLPRPRRVADQAAYRRPMPALAR